MTRVRRLLEVLGAAVRAACERHAPTGAHARAQRALAQLHLGEKKFTHTDNLMLATLGQLLFNDFSLPLCVNVLTGSKDQHFLSYCFEYLFSNLQETTSNYNPSKIKNKNCFKTKL